MSSGKLIFKPYFVQKGRGPHLLDFAYAADDQGDVFYSDICVTNDGIVISDSRGIDKFSIYTRWNVEGYGYLFMPLTKEDEYYQIPGRKNLVLNMNLELAKTRIKINQKRFSGGSSEPWKPSRELNAWSVLSNEYLRDAVKYKANPEKCAVLAQTALKYALLASELYEIERASWLVNKTGFRADFLFGCDSRSYFQMDKNLFLDRFCELFNYATITHYLKGDFIDFEPKEGKKHFAEREELLDKLLERGITVEGRPLFWIHTWVTPDWLKRKKYHQVLSYAEDHIRTVISRYGDRITVWEVVNELHDWANELELNHEQTVELTKLACDVARNINPKIKLLINNCCPFAEYVQKGQWHERPAKYRQRTPHQFTRDIIDAGVDFDIIGAQMYFTKRPLADCVAVLERYKIFGKKVQLAEVGSPSHGITQEFIDADMGDYAAYPYEWHRHWDEELQGDWLEYIFTYAYSQEWIEAANWYDFVDPFGFLKKGGLLRSPKGEKKAAVDRLIRLKEKWKNI